MKNCHFQASSSDGISASVMVAGMSSVVLYIPRMGHRSDCGDRQVVCCRTTLSNSTGRSGTLRWIHCRRCLGSTLVTTFPERLEISLDSTLPSGSPAAEDLGSILGCPSSSAYIMSQARPSIGWPSKSSNIRLS